MYRTRHLFLVTIPTTQSSPSSQMTVVPQSAKLQHIFYIMMENHGTSQILGNTADAPYLNQLATTYGIAAHYFGVTHPSLPNYLAAISGDFQGIWNLGCLANTCGFNDAELMTKLFE